MLQKLLKNPVFGYIFSRYGTYAVQFINSMLIAIYLGPVYLGIWGFINLVIQYLAQMNLGISHSVNTIASIHKHRETYISKVIGNSIAILLVLSVIVGTLFYFNWLFSWDIGIKYGFYRFDVLVFFIAILAYFNTLFSSVFRIYGKLFEIAFNQSAFPLAALPVILLADPQDLLYYLVYTLLATSLAAFVLFVIRFPVKVHFNLNRRLWWFIQKKAWFLFLYNSSFYLIIISTRSIVSDFYTVQEFGYFTFSFSLANVILLVLNAFTFLIWPKLLNSLSKLSTTQSHELIKKLRSVYVVTSHLMVHLGIFLFPFFLLFFPQYEETFEVFVLIALTIVLYTNCFGYQGLLIARHKERAVGYLSLTALILNVIGCYGLTHFFHVGFEKVILATMGTYLVYVLAMAILGRKLLNIPFNFSEILKDSFPPGIMIPLVLSLILVFMNLNPYFFFTPLVVFLVLNIKEYHTLKQTVQELILKPDKINF